MIGHEIEGEIVVVYSAMHEIPVGEYEDRVRRTQEAMQNDGLDLVLAWSDSYRMSNVRWLSNYRAFDGVIPYPAMVLIPAAGDPILFAEASLVPSAIGLTSIKDVRSIRDELGSVLKEYAASGDVQRVGIGGYRYLAGEFLDIIRESLPGMEIERTHIIDYLKSIKSENEIRSMKVAGRLADLGIEAVKQNARRGVTERELAMAAYASMFANGGDTVAFDVMVQTGENSANYYLARPTERRLQEGDVILIDMGCRYNGYASDNARGIGFGSVAPEAQKILDVCLEAWEASVKQLSPGMTGDEATKPANEVLAREGYLDGPGSGRVFGHGTGMDPEEEVPLIVPDSEWVLAENQTFSLGVTLLVPGLGGTRVEDTIVLRKDGPESLTNYPYRNNWTWAPSSREYPTLVSLT